MSESLRNDGRVWVPKKKNDQRKAADIPEEERDYYLERIYPAFGNLVPRDVASRRAKEVCDEGRGVGPTGYAVYLDFQRAIEKKGEEFIREKYGNLFDMYQSITGENPYEVPMKIYPAPHYTMGGLWVDYNLMTTIDGLFACGEANFSDHGANRLGASALMQGLADGYFVAPQTVANYLAKGKFEEITHEHPEVVSTLESVKNRIESLMNAPDPKHSPDYFHRKIGSILWTSCGMARDKESLKEAIKSIEQIKTDFWNNIKVTGTDKDFNQTLEKAGRVADFIELGHLMCVDALDREESCGAHARLEYLAESGDAMRDDENFGYVAAWEFNENNPTLHKEDLNFEFIKPTYRDYK